MITYGINLKGFIPVLLEGKSVGRIDNTDKGWVYTPKGQKTGGDPFETLSECKTSLEEE